MLRKKIYKKFKKKLKTFFKFFEPFNKAFSNSRFPILKSRGNRPLRMQFEEFFKILVFFHLQNPTSMRDLIQQLGEDDFASKMIAPEDGIQKSSFSEAMNSRGLKQIAFVYQDLCKQAKAILPQYNNQFGELVAIDGTLIDTVLSMDWADYRNESRKAKIHFGFDLNSMIPDRIYLTEGKHAERPFVDKIISVGQTGVLDRGYQGYQLFDRLQKDSKNFVCRIKDNCLKESIKQYPIKENSIVFYDEEVLLGSKQNKKQTEQSVRVVGYKVDNTKYWVATNRRDLEAEDIAQVYKLRWKIEEFFKWWKQHLKVYHLIARSKHGLMMQIYAGLCTYLLLAIYCHEQYGEKVSIKRVRELRNTMANEIYACSLFGNLNRNFKDHKKTKT